jgi:hypothetical protein
LGVFLNFLYALVSPCRPNWPALSMPYWSWLSVIFQGGCYTGSGYLLSCNIVRTYPCSSEYATPPVLFCSL